MPFELTDELRTKITTTIQAGLVSGMSDPALGKMCIESAICYALGEPHSDRPSCVAAPDRSWFSRLNDAYWPSKEARAAAFLPIAFAQLGTAGTDRLPWVKRVVDGTIRRVLPLSMRITAERLPEGEVKTALLEAAARCERDGDSASARSAQAAWRKSAGADAVAAAYAGVAVAARLRVLHEAIAVVLDAYRAESRA